MEAVTVVARFRGAESGMDDFGEWTLTENTIKHNEKHHEFNFDSVLNPSRTQEELYEAAGRKIINFFCDGYNATIFAYGQSGSGKTFSMLGPEEVTEILVNKSEMIPPEVEALFGILPRATFHIFESIKEGQAKGTKYEVRVSYIEVYNEMINDILACPPNVNLKLREFPNQGMCVIGMLETVANTPEAVFEAISAGTANRIVCSTGQNARSSRSHTVFIISLDQVLLDGTIKKSKINLVDLAGSEKLSKTGAQGQALKEAQKINLSLTTLGRCIKALTSGGSEHVPYRESKLTLILKESLSGSAMTTLIVTGSMRKVHQEETIGTMQFAERAKQVKTSAKSNAKKSYEELERLVNKLAEEVKLLKKGVVGGAISENPDPVESSTFQSVEYEELKIRYETLEESSMKQIEELRCSLERAESKMGNVDYLAIHEEMESFRERIEEGEQQAQKLLQEKETQRIDLEKKIEDIRLHSEEIANKLVGVTNELAMSNKALVSAKSELNGKDAEVFRVNQEVMDNEEKVKKFKEMIEEIENEVKYERKKRVEAEKEIAEIRKTLAEAEAAQVQKEKILTGLEKDSEALVVQIALLEKNENIYVEEIQVLKSECDKVKSDLAKAKLELEKEESEKRLKEIEHKRIRDEVLSEKQILEQELSKLKYELENVQKSNSESNLEEEKEKYAQNVTKIYSDQLARVKEEKFQLISHIQEISEQLEKNKANNENYLKENEEIKEKIKEIEKKHNKLLKELEDERVSKMRIYKSLKTVEESQEIAIIEAENRVKEEMQLSIAAFVQQDSEAREDLQRKDELLKKYKESSAVELEKLKNDLNLTKQQKHENELLLKELQSSLSLKIENFFEEKKLLQATMAEKNLEIQELKRVVSEQEGKISKNDVLISNLKSDVKQKTSERDTERKNSIIRQTLVPKRGSIFNKASAGAVPQEKGKLPAFILRKTDNKFLNDAIKEAEAISKSSSNETFKVQYEFQAIKSLYANIDDYVSVREKKDIQEVPENEEDQE